MRKLIALTAALKAAGAADDSVHSFMDRGVTIPSGKDLGNGVELGILKYDAVIQIDNYPDDAYLLLAFVEAWLQENDPDRENQGLADPEIDVDLNNKGDADVQFGIEFEESLQIVPDPDGPITYQGQPYKVADVPIDVAEKLDKMEAGTDA